MTSSGLDVIVGSLLCVLSISLCTTKTEQGSGYVLTTQVPVSSRQTLPPLVLEQATVSTSRNISQHAASSPMYKLVPDHRTGWAMWKAT